MWVIEKTLLSINDDDNKTKIIIHLHYCLLCIEFGVWVY